MAVKQNYTLESPVGITAFVNSVSKNLSEEEFAVEATVMGPCGASIVIKKDRNGYKNLVGLGLECRITMVIYEGELQVEIDHNWSNKIIALWLGCATCGSCTPTAIIGILRQKALSGKIAQAIQSAL